MRDIGENCMIKFLASLLDFEVGLFACRDLERVCKRAEKRSGRMTVGEFKNM